MSGLCDDDAQARTYPRGELVWDMDADVWEAYVTPSFDADEIFIGTHKTLVGARDLVYDWVLMNEGGKS